MAPSQLLSDHWIYGIARCCQALSILVIADACREGVRLELTADVSKGIAPHDEDTAYAEAPTIAILYSCAPGTQSFAPPSEFPSYFTQALCQALREDENLATLEELRTASERRLPLMLPAGRSQIPHIDERYQIAGRAGLPLKLIVKENLAARLRQRIANSDWCKKLRDLGNWAHVRETSPGLAGQVEAIVVLAEELVSECSKALPSNRWRDPDAAFRVLRRLELLAPPTAASPLLEPAEAAVAIATPFVYEAILAGLVLELAQYGDVLDPLELLALSSAPAFRAWREAVRTEEALLRRWTLVSHRQDQAAAGDIRCWQLWRFAHRAGELWTYTPLKPAGARGWLNPRLDALLNVAPSAGISSTSQEMRALDGRRLVRLSRLMFADADEIEIERTHRDWPLKSVGIGDGPCWRIDEPKLAHLLALAGGLALDARRLPEIGAEHIGQADGLELPGVVNVCLKRAEWQREGGALVLALECPHPALDAALQEAVAWLEIHRHRLAEDRTRSPDLASALPQAFSDRHLRPEADEDGRPRFTRPHVRFSLDQGRIFELLMGKELYGDPALALRELYQNAIDACRYRRARI